MPVLAIIPGTDPAFPGRPFLPGSTTRVAATQDQALRPRHLELSRHNTIVSSTITLRAAHPGYVLHRTPRPPKHAYLRYACVLAKSRWNAPTRFETRLTSFSHPIRATSRSLDRRAKPSPGPAKPSRFPSAYIALRQIRVGPAPIRNPARNVNRIRRSPRAHRLRLALLRAAWPAAPRHSPCWRSTWSPSSAQPPPGLE
jgi:hypothetical protein